MKTREIFCKENIICVFAVTLFAATVSASSPNSASSNSSTTTNGLKERTASDNPVTNSDTGTMPEGDQNQNSGRNFIKRGNNSTTDWNSKTGYQTGSQTGDQKSRAMGADPAEAYPTTGTMNQ